MIILILVFMSKDSFVFKNVLFRCCVILELNLVISLKKIFFMLMFLFLYLYRYIYIIVELEEF